MKFIEFLHFIVILLLHKPRPEYIYSDGCHICIMCYMVPECIKWSSGSDMKIAQKVLQHSFFASNLLCNSLNIFIG
jgi:hypothetical protein